MHRVISFQLLGLMAATLAYSTPALAQDAVSFYEANCAACHTIGQGPQGGPDLKGVTARRDREWLIRFLLDPEAFASDPVVASMIKEADGLVMPAAEGMTREMAAALLGLIDERASTAQSDDASAAPEESITAADIAHGRALFTGATRLSASGPACVACHEAAAPAPGGGRLGPDLTTVHARLGGRAGVTAWLGSTPTPVMRAVYRGAPLTSAESRAIAAYLEQSGAVAHPRMPPVLPVFALGAGGFLAALLTAGTIWGRRFRGVRATIVARSPGAPPPVRHGLGGAEPAELLGTRPDDQRGGRR